MAMTDNYQFIDFIFEQTLSTLPPERVTHKRVLQLGAISTVELHTARFLLIKWS